MQKAKGGRRKKLMVKSQEKATIIIKEVIMIMAKVPEMEMEMVRRNKLKV